MKKPLNTVYPPLFLQSSIGTHWKSWLIFGALAGVSDENAHLGTYPRLGRFNTRTIQLSLIERKHRRLRKQFGPHTEGMGFHGDILYLCTPF